MATVKDVAAHAGVSVGTVSKVLSGDATVKDALRAKVMAAVAALEYRPNMAARALRTNKINVIGLVVPDITNPFFAQLAFRIETEAAERGHMVMLANTHDDLATEARQIAALLRQAPRGLIIVATSDSSAAAGPIEVPVVSLDRRFQDSALISTDHAAGSALVAAHLVGLGHRRIAYLCGPQQTEVGRQRLNGFRDEIARRAAAHPDLVISVHEAQFDYESGEQIARRLFAQEDDLRPTAVAAASDQIALGVLRAARDMALEVPRDVAVAGFDDITLAALSVPRLTTVSQPVQALAKAAVDRILGAAGASPAVAGAPGDIFVEGALVVRGSTQARVPPPSGSGVGSGRV